MANTGLSRLVLVEPAAAIDRVARAFAVKAGYVLDGAVRVRSVEEAVAPFQRVVGTSSGRDRQLDVPLLDLVDLGREVGGTSRATSTALVFGPERSGLNNDELSLCSLLVRIPTAPEQSSLNLSQAVLLVTHTLYTASLEPSSDPASSGEPPAATEEIEGLFGHVRQVLAGVGFTRDDTADGVLRDLRQLGARAGLTSREVQILRGICRRTLRHL
jgi:tRNA (cytidine32/uridine32-2'-O)-methyltransferase